MDGIFWGASFWGRGAKKKTGRVFDSLGALYAREPGLAGPADDAKVSRHVLGRRAGG